MSSLLAKGIKKAGGPIWPSGSFRCGFRLRQVKKGTDLPRSGAPRGATIRSRIAAVLARTLLVICAESTPDLMGRGERDGGW